MLIVCLNKYLFFLIYCAQQGKKSIHFMEIIRTLHLLFEKKIRIQ
jgi:hypothetical protein